LVTAVATLQPQQALFEVLSHPSDLKSEHLDLYITHGHRVRDKLQVGAHGLL
jgi:hypothetical protein